MDASSRLTVQFETKLVSLDKKLDLVNSGLSAVKVNGKKEGKLPWKEAKGYNEIKFLKSLVASDNLLKSGLVEIYKITTSNVSAKQWQKL